MTIRREGPAILLAKRVVEDAGFAQSVAHPSIVERHLRLGAGTVAVQLEATVWDGLDEIARREGTGVDELCALIAAHLPQQGAVSLAEAIRMFALSYFRRAMPEDSAAAPPALGRLRDRVQALSADVARMPDLDTRPPDEILGFDQQGLFE